MSARRPAPRAPGWLRSAALGGALALVAPSAAAAPPQMTRDELICRAHSGLGYSYYWGGACWCRNGCNRDTSCSTGDCVGSGCPNNCYHVGTYGADCSGFTTKVWQVPNPIETTTCGHGSYTASSYHSNGTYWDLIPRGSLLRGDALASTHHVVVYGDTDPWGAIYVYEARGCIYGIVDNSRSFDGTFNCARRVNIGSGCECTPGEHATGICGYCGIRSRTCGSDCHWNAWGACTGQGECEAGSTESQPCCDCGQIRRLCSTSCEWGNWSGCSGPDPSPSAACETGQPGPCASGHIRCIEGCLGCGPDYEPVAELCNEFDDDCSGVVDDGDPTELSDPPPPYAARFSDASVPNSLEPGEKTSAWAAFVNVGAQSWAEGEVWLTAASAEQEELSQLYDEESWPAWDVAAVLDRSVAPGEQGFFHWTMKAPTEPDTVAERFRLQGPSGRPVQCPAATVDVAIRIGGAHAEGHEEGGSSPDASDESAGGCSCVMVHPTRPSGAPVAGLLAMAAALWRRRRRAARAARTG